MTVKILVQQSSLFKKFIFQQEKHIMLCCKKGPREQKWIRWCCSWIVLTLLGQIVCKLFCYPWRTWHQENWYEAFVTLSLSPLTSQARCNINRIMHVLIFTTSHQKQILTLKFRDWWNKLILQAKNDPMWSSHSIAAFKSLSIHCAWHRYGFMSYVLSLSLKTQIKLSQHPCWSWYNTQSEVHKS